jgi:LuxR family maltose regulon positive regulatory protein
VLRPRLIERLNKGLNSKLTLISAPAGFGKTTLVSQWLASCGRPAAWLSLDEGENDPTRFLTYLVAAVQTIATNIGEGVSSALRSSQPPPPDALLTALLNDITTLADPFILVLDDYHVIDARPVDQALTFLLDHLPPQMHLVIATREDPSLPLARFRVRNQLTEVRISDLRFTYSEASAFLTQVMGLPLSADNIAALDRRTEGWIAGLQLAALSLQGHPDATSFITAFTGSHHFVLDYLVEEVLHQQSTRVQIFLLRTSILDRMSGPLCDAVAPDATTTGQATLDYLERANLFLVPLDNERRWYRYHHLFADLLQRRLHQHAASSSGEEREDVAELHRRASVWYEDNDLLVEAFEHAAAANDIERAARLMEGEGMPLHFRGAVAPVLSWLASLPTTVLDARPSLWVMFASALSMAGQHSSVEQKLQAAEAALQGTEPDDRTRNLIGHIAAIRAMMAVPQYHVETIMAQSRRALEYLHPNNLPVRTATIWKMGFAHQLQGDRAAASRTYTEAISISQVSGNTAITLLATIGLGNIQEADNQLHLAARTYQRVLQLGGDPPLPIVCEGHLGLARVCYEWNDLDAAQQHGQQSLQLARQIENADRFVSCEVFLARLKLARGDVAGATALLAEAGQSVRQHNFVHRIPEVAVAHVLTLLHQSHLAAAARLVQAHDLPISQARVHLAQGDTSAALKVLSRWREQVEAKGWEDERLKVMVLQAVTLSAHGDGDKALHLLSDALALAEPAGFVRLFVDEGLLMARLLSEAVAYGMMPDYVGKLLAVFEAEKQRSAGAPPPLTMSSSQPPMEPLSQRELEVLRLIAHGLSNREIGERLFLALDTVKGHNRRIFDKLRVQRRNEAIARARQLGLL